QAPERDRALARPARADRGPDTPRRGTRPPRRHPVARHQALRAALRRPRRRTLRLVRAARAERARGTRRTPLPGARSVIAAARPTRYKSGVAEAAVIEARGLVKRYGDLEAVRGLDLTVATGETFGFLGPNGAGKSTTIKILCTLALPSAGHASVGGFDVVRERAAVRRNIGLVFQDTTLDQYLSAERNLRFHGELYG